MRTALLSRAVIDHAKGILMGQRRCTTDEAFVLLTTISQHSSRRLRDVAAALVATAHPTGNAESPQITDNDTVPLMGDGTLVRSGGWRRVVGGGVTIFYSRLSAS